MGIEPTTSGLDLPSLCRLSYKVAQRKSGTILDGESRRREIYTSELILCSIICVPSATRHNIYMYPYFLFAAIHHLKSSPTFSVRPCSSVGRVTEDLIRRSWVRFPPRSKYFFFASCGSLFPFPGLTPSGLFMGERSTLIYTSELIPQNWLQGRLTHRLCCCSGKIKI